MRNCEIVNEILCDENHYYDVVTKNTNKHFYFKQLSKDEIKVISFDEYNKVLNNSKGLTAKNKIIRKLVLPVILSGMVTSSLSGCSKKSESNVEPTKTEINQDLMDDIKSGKKIDSNEDGSITYHDDYEKKLTVDDLKKYGVKLELVTSYSPCLGYSIYRVDSLDLNKVPKNILFEQDNVSYNKSYNVNLDMNVTWDDCIKEIEKKNIDEKYKKILINAIEKYKTLGLENGLPMFYDNIKNSRIYNDNNYNIAFFDHINKELVIGEIDIEKNKELKSMLDELKKLNKISNEEYNMVLTEHEYILTHELGHAISSYYNSKTYELVSNKSDYALVDPATNNVEAFFQVGKFVSEGYADYMVYEVLNRKPNEVYGYPINQCLYLMIKEMLNINTIEELRTLDTDKMIQKLGELGFEDPFDRAFILEDSVNTDYSATADPYYQINNNDFTPYFELFFAEYYMAQTKNGVSKEEIREVFNKIIKDIKERVYTSKIENELYVKGTGGATLLNISSLENLIDVITNQKSYLK